MSLGGVGVTLFAYVSNLFDVKNVINVYSRSGNAYDDGFLTDPELSKNFNEIINPSTRKNDLKEETKEKSNESVEVEKNINQTTSLKKENLPTGLKHIKDNEEDEKENKES